MISKKTIHEILIEKPTLTEKFIRCFDQEWGNAVSRINSKVIWVKNGKEVDGK